MSFDSPSDTLSPFEVCEYLDNIGLVSLIKEVWQDAYKCGYEKGYSDGLDDGKAEGIQECIINMNEICK